MSMIEVRGRQVRAGYRPPRGWVLERLIDRDAFLVLPRWLWLVRRAWALRWRAIEQLVAWDVLDVDEGDYLVNARPRCPSWLWCFLHDRDADPPRSTR
jgi:hypothetical protein